MHVQRPVRVQHRSGALWVLNSAAAALAGLDTADHPGVERYGDGRPTGRVWRADTWLRDRLPVTAPPPLDAIGAQLAAYGVTGLTDATPDLSPSSLTALVSAHGEGALPQRLHLLGAPSGFVSPSGTLASGPYKIVLADSGLPDLDVLAETIRSVHAAGRAVAVHCVSREAFAILLAVTGIYGMSSNSILLRSHEIGLRRALGASNEAVVATFVTQGVKQLARGLGVSALLCAGILVLLQIGFSIGYAAMALLAGGVVLVVSSCVLLSIYLAVRRVIRLEPSAALRVG
jgi:hypothetical protein